MIIPLRMENFGVRERRPLSGKRLDCTGGDGPGAGIFVTNVESSKKSVQTYAPKSSVL